MTRNATEPADGVSQRTLEILREVTGERDVLTDPDLPLYTSGLLDSLGTVTLMVEIEQAFGITISPAEFDKEAWATPRAIVADLERRLAGGRAS